MPHQRQFSTYLRAAAIVVLLSGAAAGQSPNQVTGFVFDQNGAAIKNAFVEFIELSPPRARHTTSTDASGRFVFDGVSDHRGKLTVSATGFRDSTITSLGANVEIRITLAPASVDGIVTISRSETRIEENPASIVALGRRDLETTAAATLDDRLRQVPGFSLFRRSGSRTANPTTQGVSLRGVGASGASRSLVLVDGMPLNDPFGGWIFWGRVPFESIEQIEVLRGPAGDLYGSSAVGGVIAIRTVTPGARPFFGLEAAYGTQRTPSISVYASVSRANWTGSIAGEFFRTGGFVIVDESQRGAADIKANVERHVLIPFVQRSFSDRGRVFVSAELFQEMRGNGTRLQTNDTRIRNFTAGADWSVTPQNRLYVRVNGGTQRYNQTFSAVSPDRNTETFNRQQRVPVEFFAASTQWTGTYDRNVFFAGFDMRLVRGHSDEVGIASGIATSASDSGGRELTNGIFGGAVLALSSRFTLSGGARVDWWRNTGGFSLTTSLTSGASTLTNFADRSESAFSPRVSALYQLTDHLSVAASIGTGFRRPTLNELYRTFRVGDVITLANSDLRAERALGYDAAVTVNAFSRRLYLRAGPFCTSISDNVSNVTLSAGPTLIIRRRTNVGRTRSCGIETDWNFSATDRVKISGGHLFADSRVVDFPANQALEGRRIPQVAAHQFSLQLAYSAPRFGTVAAQIRAVGPQFEDDQNQFRLRAFTTVDVFASRRIGPRIEAFLAAENLFDTKIEAGRTPVLTLGTPRALRAGIRLRLGRR
jgi:outer membrane receptor protein involved in Fe transport